MLRFPRQLADCPWCVFSPFTGRVAWGTAEIGGHREHFSGSISRMQRIQERARPTWLDSIQGLRVRHFSIQCRDSLSSAFFAMNSGGLPLRCSAVHGSAPPCKALRLFLLNASSVLPIVVLQC